MPKTYIFNATQQEELREAERKNQNKYADRGIKAVLQRHDWRNVMPRSKHPNKASGESIEASKKFTLK